jgi:hypothetical protein
MADHRPREGTDHPREPDREGAGKQPETAPDGEAVSGFPEPPAGASSTSDPHPSQDPEAEPVEAPERDRLDD